MIYELNSTSVSVIVQIVDDSGAPVAGLNATSFPSITLVRPTNSEELQLYDLTEINDAHKTGGVINIDKNRYRLDLPDSHFEIAGNLDIIGEETGKRLLHPQIQIGVLCEEIASDIIDAVYKALEDVNIRPTKTILGPCKRSTDHVIN